MEDGYERWKHKEEAKAKWKDWEYDTNSAEKAAHCTSIQNICIFWNFVSYYKIVYQNSHSENVLLLCFCQDVNSKGRGFYMQGFYT